MKILFLDLDGTIRESASGKTFINNPEDQQLIAGAKEAITKYKKKGWIMIGITNQKGIMFGYKTLDNAIKEQRITMELAPEIKKIYFCPDEGESMVWVDKNHYSIINEDTLGEYEDIDNFRKPNTGMIDYFLSTHKDITETLFVGDMDSDRECAEKAGISFIEAEEWREEIWIV